jgi:uncharacterized protein (DUF1810 family)
MSLPPSFSIIGRIDCSRFCGSCTIFAHASDVKDAWNM